MKSSNLPFAASIAFFLAACGSNSGPQQGTETGPCYPNLTCNNGLTCLSGLCVYGGPGLSGTGGASSTGGRGGGRATGGIGGQTDSRQAGDSGVDAPVSGSGGDPGTGGTLSTGGRGGDLGGSGGTETPSASGGATGGPGQGNTVTFVKGKATGAMWGYGWFKLGAWDNALSPICIPYSGADATPITGAAPCPTCGGKLLWNPAHPDALCVTGTIPKVTKGDAGTDDYDNNWGMQIGVNAGVVNECENPGAATRPTLGRSFETIAFQLNTAAAVTPAYSVVRGRIHRAGDPEDLTYCAAVLVSASGAAAPILLSSFNTKCWGDPTTVFLKAEDVPNIDWVGVQISSDNLSAYTVDNFCLTSITFLPVNAPPGKPGTGGAIGTGGAPGTGGSPPLPPEVDCPDTSTFAVPVAGAYATSPIPLDNDPNKRYLFQANWWGQGMSKPTENINGIGFTINHPGGGASPNDNPMGFPSLYIGSYQGKGTPGSNLPKQVSRLTNVWTIFSTNADQKGSSQYNAAYDVWLSQESGGITGSDPGPGGAFLMVWLFNPLDRKPRGTIKANGHAIHGIPGSWSVWLDNTNPPCVTFVSDTPRSSLAFDLVRFIQDAIDNKWGVNNNQYLSIIFAGFEVWAKGDGLQVKQFCANVK